MTVRVTGERMEYLLINDAATICFQYDKKRNCIPSLYLTKKSNPDGKEIKVKGKASKLTEG